MTDKEKVFKDLKVQNRVCDVVSEQIVMIDGYLCPVKVLKKLSKSGKLDVATFAAMEINELAELTFQLADALQDCKVVMKSVRTSLEDLDDISITVPCSDNTPELHDQISDLQIKLDNFVSAKPPDWSKVDFTQQLTEAVAKAPQLQSPVSQVNSRQQVKQANEEHLRSNNLIIYNVPHDKTNRVMALTYARDYFDQCGITSYYLNQSKILDAQFLSISEDGTMCNLRVIMNNPWVVRALLSDARKLRSTEATEYRSKTLDFSRTYISKDMTKVEQEINRKLVLELKRNISNDSSTRWVIKFGKVQAAGTFTPRS